MKFLQLFIIVLLFISPTNIFAQTFKSDQFMTKVGDPQGPPPSLLPGTNNANNNQRQTPEIINNTQTREDNSCPVRKSVISCGTYWHPVPFAGGLCGHCRNDGTVKYGGGMAGNFKADGTQAMDSQGNWLGGSGTCVYAGTAWGIDVDVPNGGEIILPTVYGKIIQWKYYTSFPTTTNQQIQGFTGTSPEGEKYYLQLHHTRPGSANTNASVSGDLGAYNCDMCQQGPHVHIQISTGAPAAGGSNWIDPLSTQAGSQLMCGGGT